MSEFCVFSCVQMQFASTQVFRHTNLSLQWSAPLRQTIHNRCGGRSHRSRDDINGGNSLTKDYRPNHGWRWWSCNCKFLLNIRRIFCCAWARYVTSTTALCMDQEIKKYNIYIYIYIYCLFIYFYLYLFIFIYLFIYFYLFLFIFIFIYLFIFPMWIGCRASLTEKVGRVVSCLECCKQQTSNS